MPRWSMLKNMETLCIFLGSQQGLEDTDETRALLKELGVKCPVLRVVRLGMFSFFSCLARVKAYL